jgi:hypothetical protein
MNWFYFCLLLIITLYGSFCYGQFPKKPCSFVRPAIFCQGGCSGLLIPFSASSGITLGLFYANPASQGISGMFSRLLPSYDNRHTARERDLP